MRILVSTCDKYDYLLPGFAWCFNKFWPHQTVDVLGYRQPPALPANFVFHSLNPVEDKPFTFYMRKYIADMPDHHFVFLFDDYWLKDYVATVLVSIMEQEVIAGAAKGDLSQNTQYFAHGLFKSMGPGNPRLIIAEQNAGYRTSTQPCIWQRDYLLKLMDPKGLTPWEFELQGTAANDGAKIVGTEMQLYKYANVVHKGQADYYMIDQIDPVTKRELQALGYETIFENKLNFNQFTYANFLNGQASKNASLI